MYSKTGNMRRWQLYIQKINANYYYKIVCNNLAVTAVVDVKYVAEYFKLDQI